MINLILTILGTVLAAAAGLFKWNWELGTVIVLLGTALTVYGAIAQYKDSQAFEFEFAKGEWKSLKLDTEQETNDTQYEIVIERRKHRKPIGTSVNISMKNPDGFETVLTDNGFQKDGRLFIRAREPFDGKVVVG